MNAAHSSSASLLTRLLAGLLSALLAVGPMAAQDTPAPTQTDASPAQAGSDSSKSSPAKPSGAKKKAPAARKRKSPQYNKAAARAALLHQAFTASTELRPMAQQLAMLRTPAAYAGVTEYAHKHTGEAAAAGYLALGHAYLLDKKYPEAIANLQKARQTGTVLADYADFLAAEANHDAGNVQAAESLLKGFAARYPDSIFDAQSPELEANVLLAVGDAAGALRVLTAATGSSSRTGYQLALGQAELSLGKKDAAEQAFKHLLLSHPLSADAQVARTRLTAMGAESALSTAELRSLAEAYYNGGRYAEASEQYHALARAASADSSARASFAVAAAACELKLKRLTKAEAEALPNTKDDNGARRLELLMELARNNNDLDEQRSIVTRMETDFPQSQWLAEALYSSGNMYLLRRDYSVAVDYYSKLAAQFPNSSNASAAHWRAAWLSYRLGKFTDAARLFDEQIKLYPAAKETAAAIYWRGRLYELEDHKPELAVANYRALNRAYQHFFYAQMARERLAALGNTQPAPQPQLDGLQPQPVPELEPSFPNDSPHLAKARLLANAGLNDYIAQEIAADPNSASWSSLAEAQIYASFDDPYRALRALKKGLPYAATASVKSIPLVYWRILFPEPWWETIQAESARNHLDPYLVASLIRQESEFNASAISRANAYGLMQLLPSVGRQMAKEEGLSHFETFQLLDPVTNIQLGTRYLRQMLDKFGGVTEYALAAYNAGDNRVVDWQSAGPYRGIDEFVESIPFTETREYVEAILRNQETYKAIDAAAAAENGKH